MHAELLYTSLFRSGQHFSCRGIPYVLFWSPVVHSDATTCVHSSPHCLVGFVCLLLHPAASSISRLRGLRPLLTHQHNTINIATSTQHHQKQHQNIMNITASTQHHQKQHHQNTINITASTQHHQHDIIQHNIIKHNIINITASTQHHRPQHHQHYSVNTTSSNTTEHNIIEHNIINTASSNLHHLHCIIIQNIIKHKITIKQIIKLTSSIL